MLLKLKVNFCLMSIKLTNEKMKEVRYILIHILCSWKKRVAHAAYLHIWWPRSINKNFVVSSLVLSEKSIFQNINNLWFMFESATIHELRNQALVFWLLLLPPSLYRSWPFFNFSKTSPPNKDGQYNIENFFDGIEISFTFSMF